MMQEPSEQTQRAAQQAIHAARLTGRQRRFVEAYLANGNNGTQAARAAGYGGSYATLRAIACQNLRKPNIAGVVDAYMAAFREEIRTQTRHR